MCVCVCVCVCACVHVGVARVCVWYVCLHTVCATPQEMKTTPNSGIFRVGVSREGVFKLANEDNKVRGREEMGRRERRG